MKIRCEQGSIRLRLRKSELDILKETHHLYTAVTFPDGAAFRWTLQLDPAATHLEAEFSNGNILVRTPQAAALIWADNNEVGLEHFQSLPDGTSLHVLVEKDFPCKDRPDEDKADFFTELATQHPPVC